MKVLVMNCSPVRNGATAEIVNIVAKDVELVIIQQNVFRMTILIG